MTLRVDRGPQFTARSFREAARILNVRLEYAGIQCPEDKPYIDELPPEKESSFMLDWKLRKGALDGQKVLHRGADYQQAA